METQLERIAAKAKKEPKTRFTSLAHHITKDRIGKNLGHMNKRTAPGIDGVTVEKAIKDFSMWVEPMISSLHRESYKPSAVKRVWIPKPGKAEKRPIGVPGVADRALQRSVAEVLGAVYEQDFLDCSFGGRPGIGQRHALATLNEIIAGKKVSWVFEADLKNFFGSLDHDWVLKFVEHRIGDPRIIQLIKRWLKAGVLEEGKFQASEVGTPQGGSISVLLSNLYLHYVLDLWFEKVIKPNLKGEAYLIRYIDDFIVCFQYRADARSFMEALEGRLKKFALQIEPNKTRLVEFGRFADKHAKERGRKMETIYFLGFTHFCTRNRSGNFMVGRKTEKSRLKRSVIALQIEIRQNRHAPLKEQCERINQILRGHYNYYGLAGNLKALFQVYERSKLYWRKLLGTRSQKSYVSWEEYREILSCFPLLRPKLSIPYRDLQMYAVL